MKKVHLKTGTLNIDLNENLDQYVSYSSRINKKRGFFFVSKVLGKHIPTKPSVMLNTYKDLASLIPKTDEPTLFIGFAEAATALGQGVFEQYNSNNSFYIHSTRFQTSNKLLFSFKEEHSHAPHHLFYEPIDNDLKIILNNITRIILVDDEASTGNTANNLVNELKNIFPKVNNYLLLTILDWSTKKYDNFEIKSLVKSNYKFESNNIKLETNIVSEPLEVNNLNEIIPFNFGRYGTGKLNLNFDKLIDLNHFIDKKILVLGSAEFMYPPYLLAKYLEDNKVDCYFQATTRSPINIDGVISSKIEFKDNYFENIDNFIYNVIDKEYDKVLVCYETVSLPENFHLKKQLEQKFDTQEIFFNV
jgi:hypothetical protein